MKIPTLPAWLKLWLFGVICTIVGGIVYAIFGVKIPNPVFDEDAPGMFGWVDDPAEVKAIKSTLTVAEFESTPAFQQAPDSPDCVYGWRPAHKAHGGPLPCWDQRGVGSCVGFGATAAVEYANWIEVASGDLQGPIPHFAQEVTYAGSRVEIGGKGRGSPIAGDGSTVAWAAKFLRDYGLCPRDRYGTLDLTEYREDTCRRLGRQGLPPAVEQACKRYPVREISQVRSADAAMKALAQGYMLSCGSIQGFRMRRQADGSLIPWGRWGHCTAVIGYEKNKGFLHVNSWGPSAHRGPKVPEDMPDCSFWVTWKVADRMYAEGDTWALSHSDGFPAKKLDWGKMNALVPPAPAQAENQFARGWVDPKLLSTFH